MPKSKGCIRTVIGGCFSLFSFIVLIGIALSVARRLFLPSLNFQGPKLEGEVQTTEVDGNTLYRVQYTWEQPTGFFQNNSYKLTFNIPKKEVDAAIAYLKYISRLSYEEIGADESVYYYDSLQFYCEYWRIVYGKLLRTNSVYISSIRKKLIEIMEYNNLSPNERVNFLISFVQNIDYRIPQVPLGVFPPVLTLKEHFADCDSKALLLYLLLEGLNINCVIFYSPYYQHAMLGVDYSGLKDRKIHQGHYYYFLETTYPGWEIGQLPPEMKNQDLWYILDLKQI